MTDLTVTAKVHFTRGRRTQKEIQPGETPERDIPDRLPRIAKLMALAIRYEGFVRDGVVADYAELARLGHVTRARMSQITSLCSSPLRSRKRSCSYLAWRLERTRTLNANYDRSSRRRTGGSSERCGTHFRGIAASNDAPLHSHPRPVSGESQRTSSPANGTVSNRSSVKADLRNVLGRPSIAC
jgi:hypothetical protein